MIASAAATAVRAVALGRATHRATQGHRSLHQEPPTLLLIKLELDRSGCFGRHRRPRPSRALPRFCEMSTTRQRRPLLAGVLILLMPRLLNYIVAIYLIVVGLVGLNGIYHFMR